ncbi:MAG: hypothetical protein AAGI45_00775 [Cyanobacteria bacterium P01_H01_bin.26]
MDFDIRRIVGQCLLGIGAFGIVLADAADGLSVGFPPAERDGETSAEYSPGGVPKQAESGEFARYDSAEFSVDYPMGWQVSPHGETGVEISGTADGVTMAIRTEIVVFREDPQTSVPQRLDQIVAEALSVQRYSLVTVDGQSGIRIWYESEADRQALVTFVGYGNQQTVVLTSEYAQAAIAEPLATQIHDSFVNHSMPQMPNGEN